MSADATTFEIEPRADSPSASLVDRLLWPLLLMFAWLAFELTTNATLSLVLACMKFGWNDCQTASWLWRTDPQRPRARACATFYVASGIWKTAIVPLVVAGVISIAWALYSPNAMRPDHPGTIQLQKALFVGGCAVALLVIVVGAAVALALGARWRVWVHPDLHRSRRQDVWPPEFLPGTTTRDNHARLIVMTSFITLVLIGPIITLSLLSRLPMARRAQPLASLSVVFGFPIFTVLALSFLRNNLFAESPWECWPESIRQLDATRDTIATAVLAQTEQAK
ncbi:MAG: hypothetical protein AAGD11_09690 [Planctomycetota bacterium]